mgnify:CR=1 FL=1
MKKYANSALIYAILAMVGGVFFREFTKFNGFEGQRPSRSSTLITLRWA